jgi:exonuclease III
MVNVLMLYTRGIKGKVKQIKLALYAKRQKAQILLLQETNLSQISELPGLPQYITIQNIATQVGSGTAIALHKDLQPHMKAHSHQNLVTGYLQTCQLTIYDTEIQIINIYMPINTKSAITVLEVLNKHMETIPLKYLWEVTGTSHWKKATGKTTSRKEQYWPNN